MKTAIIACLLALGLAACGRHQDVRLESASLPVTVDGALHWEVPDEGDVVDVNDDSDSDDSGTDGESPPGDFTEEVMLGTLEVDGKVYPIEVSTTVISQLGIVDVDPVPVRATLGSRGGSHQEAYVITALKAL
ncbi:MAG TPA: hypothetical protein VMF52_11005 [Steroidobacteraceae bacterium]|nr:hypothetical protein [Steroidobacteraceae bacterium]